MPALTITAVANGADTITIVGHGLVTGDGPAAVRVVGGALPSPLVEVTDYWLIRVDDDTLKLATSSADAMSGTAINLTDDGSGTLYLEIGIPYRRPRTYALGSQLKSADLNDNFDAWKAIYALLTGQAQSVWSDVRFNVSVAEMLNLAAGMQISAGPYVIQGILSPPTLAAGNNNNYNPTGLSAAIVVRLTPDTGSFLTGIAAPGIPGRTITLVNLGPDDITVTHDDGSSSAANRFALPNGATITMRDHGSITAWYDFTSSRWRLLSQSV